MTTIDDATPTTEVRAASLREATLPHDLVGLRSTVAEVILTRTHRVVVDVRALGASTTAVVAVRKRRRPRLTVSSAISFSSEE